MTEFWLAAGVLLLTALAFLLIPLLLGRRAQREEDRTALNVALYQERLAELQAQHAAGALDAAALQAGKDEAARELLADTETAGNESAARQSRSLPLLLSLLLPAVALGLYLHWGASDALALRFESATPPNSVEQMVDRLERTVKIQPNAAEAWYYLGRAYLGQQRPADAARAFEKTIALAGRQPELLAQLAQAQYFVNGQKFTDQVRSLCEEVLKADPQEPTTLGLMGIAAFEAQNFADAIRYWQRLASTLEVGDPSRDAIQGGIDRAREQLIARGEPLPAEPVAPVEKSIQVSVALAPELAGKVQPDDTVFIFARAASGPPMPLAVKRLKVSELPATVTLADKDAMMPQLKISGFAEIRLSARISRSGNATQGEWIGQSGVLKTADTSAQKLVIDTPDQKQ